MKTVISIYKCTFKGTKRITYKACPLFYLLPQREKQHKPALPVNMCPKAAATLPALVLVVMHTRKCSSFCFLCQSFCAESVRLSVLCAKARFRSGSHTDVHCAILDMNWELQFGTNTAASWEELRINLYGNAV